MMRLTMPMQRNANDICTHLFISTRYHAPWLAISNTANARTSKAGPPPPGGAGIRTKEGANNGDDYYKNYLLSHNSKQKEQQNGYYAL